VRDRNPEPSPLWRIQATTGQRIRRRQLVDDPGERKLEGNFIDAGRLTSPTYAALLDALLPRAWS
jgi:hypothetical protein